MMNTTIKTYEGFIQTLPTEDCVFVFGSNPEGRHGKGAALVALRKFGAVRGKGRGLQDRSYALVTKNLRKGFVESATGIKYGRAGPRSVSRDQIVHNVRELYATARANPKKSFYVAYRAGGTYLNGYADKEMAAMFAEAGDIPDTMIFEKAFRLLVQEHYTTTH